MFRKLANQVVEQKKQEGTLVSAFKGLKEDPSIVSDKSDVPLQRLANKLSAVSTGLKAIDRMKRQVEITKTETKKSLFKNNEGGVEGCKGCLSDSNKEIQYVNLAIVKN